MRVSIRSAALVFCGCILNACSSSGDDGGVPSDDAGIDSGIDSGPAPVDTAVDAPVDTAVCPAGQDLCGGKCVEKASDPRNCGACGTACKTGEVCSVGKCALTCGGGTSLCSGLCKDTQSDVANCGACGTACAAGQVCTAGACKTTCGAGQTDCGGTCRDTSTDRANCGACGTSCKAGEVCSAGACALSCGAPLTLCSGAPAGDAGVDGGDASDAPASAPYCANTDSDRLNCGACGVACDAGKSCVGGACSTSCGGGLVDCGDGKCRDLSSDNSKCGASCAAATACASGTRCSVGICASTCATGTIDCGDGICRDISSDNAKCGATCATATACGAGKVCSAGSCASTCAVGTVDCGDGKCRDLSSDNAKCGTSCAAATACGAGKVCSAGSCGSTCATGTIDCGDGKCRDLSSDRSKCGLSCATAAACASGQVCTASACVASCSAGLTVCSGACTNTAFDPSNCGACGTVCATGTACVSSTCRPLAGASKLYLANWAGFNTNFNVYDIAKATWSAGATLPVASRGQLATTGSTVRMFGTDGFVYEYVPVSNTWAKGIAGPSVASFSFFQYLNGNMYLCQNGSTTLNIHNGTAWSTLTLAAACSIAGGVDPVAKQVYIKTYGQAGFTVINATTNTIVRTITDTTGIGENTSSAAFLSGVFYTRSSSGNIFALDGVTGTRTDTGQDPGGAYPGFVSDSGVIYMLSGSSFKTFKPGTGFTSLTAGPNEGTLSTITVTN